MAPKRPGSKQQQQLNVDQYTLLKKPMEQLGKQINVPGSFWHLKENFCDPDAGLIMKDFPSTLALKDRELREDKSTFTTKDSDYLCTAVTTARKVLRDELNARVFHGSSDLRPSNTRLIQAYMSKQIQSKDYLPLSWNDHGLVTRHEKTTPLLCRASGPFHGLSSTARLPLYIGVAGGTSTKFRPEPHASD
jgi:hypothetical protein